MRQKKSSAKKKKKEIVRHEKITDEDNIQHGERLIWRKQIVKGVAGKKHTMKTCNGKNSVNKWK